MTNSIRHLTFSEQHVVRLTPEVSQRVHAQAEFEDRPVMWIWRKAIEQYLAREDRKRTNGRKRG